MQRLSFSLPQRLGPELLKILGFLFLTLEYLHMYTEYLRERSLAYLDMNFMVHIYICALYAEPENNFAIFFLAHLHCNS